MMKNRNGATSQARLKYDYHDSHLVSHSIGPRHEAVLVLHLDAVWNRTSGVVTLRCGAVENMDDLKRFLSALPKNVENNRYICEIGGLHLAKNHLKMETVDYGTIDIHSQKITERLTEHP